MEVSNLFKPLEPTEFCQTWVSVIYGGTPSQFGYRKTCCQLLARITEKSQYTCGNWLSHSERCPDTIKKLLRVVDYLWKIEQSSPKSLEKLQSEE